MTNLVNQFGLGVILQAQGNLSKETLEAAPQSGYVGASRKPVLATPSRVRRGPCPAQWERSSRAWGLARPDCICLPVGSPPGRC